MISKQKIAAFLAAFALLLGFGLATAGSAAAVQNKSCTAGAYTYYGTVDFTRASNITFSYWSVSGPSPMEYRVRWVAPDGSTVIYDTGYQAYNNSPQSGNPGVSRYLVSNSHVWIDAGKYGDGVATCRMDFTIPPN